MFVNGIIFEKEFKNMAKFGAHDKIKYICTFQVHLPYSRPNVYFIMCRRLNLKGKFKAWIEFDKITKTINYPQCRKCVFLFVENVLQSLILMKVLL